MRATRIISSPAWRTKGMAAFACLVILIPQTFAGAAAIGSGMGAALRLAARKLQGEPPMYVDVPIPPPPPDPAPDPSITPTSISGGIFEDGGNGGGGGGYALANNLGPPLPWEACAGGYWPRTRVNTTTGNVIFALPLIDVPSFGPDLGFSLYYNSTQDLYSNGGLFGTSGWTCSFDWRVDPITIGDGAPNMYVHYPNGLAVDFSKATTPGFYDKYASYSDGTQTLTRKDQSVIYFDPSGKVTSIRDRRGNMVTIARTSSSLTATDASGRTLTLALNAGGQPTSMTDPIGRVWTFSYTSGRLTGLACPIGSHSFSYGGLLLTSRTDPTGGVWHYAYDVNNFPTSLTDPLGNATSFSFGASSCTFTQPGGQTTTDTYSSGVLTSRVDPAGFSVALSNFDTNHNPQTVIDQRGNTRNYTWDVAGNMLSEYLAGPTNIIYWSGTYNATNDLTSEWDGAGTTSYTYDSSGNLLSVVNPLSQTRLALAYATPSKGLPTSAADALGNTTTLAYGYYGDLTGVTDPLGRAATFTYDAVGRRLTAVDPLGNTETFYYDSMSRVWQINHPDTTHVNRTYDASGRLLTATDELGHVTTLAYNAAGWLASLTNARGDAETYAYNSNGWRTSVTNGRGNTRTYAYTPRGEVYTLSLPDGAHETWSYTGTGQVGAYTNPLGQAISYTYDNKDRQTGVGYPSGTGVSFSYDGADRVTSMADASGTTSWTYDAASQATQLATPQGTISYAYDAAGRRTSMNEYGTGTTTYAYNAASELASLANAFAETTSWTYDGAGRLSRQNYASGAYATYGYDTRSRLTSLLHRTSGGSTITSESYAYNQASNLTSKTVDSATTTYGYDAIDQLTSESSPGYSASYTYDANGNRLSKTLGGSTDNYTYDSGDKMLTAGAKSFGYDAAGRRTSMAVGGQTTSYSYDYEDRLTGITYPGGATNSFSYNALDTRVGKVDSGGSKTFKRDGVFVTDPVVNDGSASYGFGISERRGGATKFYHGDRMSSFNKLTDTSQTTTDTKGYDAFGMLLAAAGATPTPFGYSGGYGYQEDADSGLKVVGYRSYEAGTGRFITRDPIGQGRNWYAYCAANPLRYCDPTGAIHIVIAIGEDGIGHAKVFADAGDIIGMTDDCKPIYSLRGGELLETFDVSNRVPRPDGDPKETGSAGPFPDGTYTIDSIGHGRKMGPDWLHLAEPPASARGTWVHSGAGDNWRRMTGGCIRGRERDISSACLWYEINKHNKNRHRVTVTHVPGQG